MGIKRGHVLGGDGVVALEELMVVKKKETRRTKCEAGEQQVLRTLPKEISTPPTGGPWPVCVSSPEDSGDFLQESLTVQYRRYMKAEIRFGKLGKYSSDLICAELRISISAHILPRTAQMPTSRRRIPQSRFSLGRICHVHFFSLRLSMSSSVHAIHYPF